MEIENLRGHIPDEVLEMIPDVIEIDKVNTPLRLAHFLAQCKHESGNFKFVRENLNYSAKGLQTTFKKYFPTKELALEYERQPEKIASRVYANRMGNGDEESGDGWTYRGRGFIQLTGKDNYAAFSEIVEEDILEEPDLVATKYPLLSAAWFFNQHCMHKADYGPSEATIIAVTKCVNGGTNGLPERIDNFDEFYDLLQESE